MLVELVRQKRKHIVEVVVLVVLVEVYTPGCIPEPPDDSMLVVAIVVVELDVVVEVVLVLEDSEFTSKSLSVAMFIDAPPPF